MVSDRFDRFLPLAGVLAGLLFFVALVLLWEDPTSEIGPAETFAYCRTTAASIRSLPLTSTTHPAANKPRHVREHRRGHVAEYTGGARRGGGKPASQRSSPSRPRRPVRLHRDGAESREAESAAGAPRDGQKDKSTSGPLADEFVRNFIQAEPIPGIVYEYGLNQRFMPEITLAEVNAVARDWMPDRNRVVAITAPEKDRPSLPTEAKLAAVINAASGAPLTAYVDRTSTQPLLSSPPFAGSHRHHLDERGAGHHRVAFVQRRTGRAQADDVQAGRDPVPGGQPRRHLARERRGLHPG